MRLVFEENGKWVALMVWGSACYHLKPRDAYVGWTNSIRTETRTHYDRIRSDGPAKTR